MLLVLAGIESPALRMVYVTLFGLGSVAGMAAVTVVLTLPLVLSARRAPALGPRGLDQGFQGVAGAASVLIGGLLLYQTSVAGGLVL